MDSGRDGWCASRFLTKVRDSGGVDRVRSFNRTVTARIGALQDEYLARGRPLGASRVLWEIGASDTDVRALRARLGLDSGYLSRLLRALEAEGLVKVAPAPDDKRIRTLRLTARGRAEHARLDRESDALASSLLAPLSEAQQAKLIDAMSTVERLLTAGVVAVAIEDPRSEAAQFCLRSYYAELDERFDTGFDPELAISTSAAELTEPAGLFVVARLHDEPIGCGALKLQGETPFYIKRVWVAPSARGLGVGRRLLSELEGLAAARGARVVSLETNRVLREATSLYRAAGYVEVEPFNAEPYAHHWLQKRLSPT